MGKKWPLAARGERGKAKRTSKWRSTPGKKPDQKCGSICCRADTCTLYFVGRYYKKCPRLKCQPESNLLELARGLVRELFPNSFSIYFSKAADWRRFHDVLNNVAFCQSAARDKEIEKEFGNNSRTSPLASSKGLDFGFFTTQNCQKKS
jgi:hypothetical protein